MKGKWRAWEWDNLIGLGGQKTRARTKKVKEILIFLEKRSIPISPTLKWERNPQNAFDPSGITMCQL